jgi:dTMP kinase
VTAARYIALEGVEGCGKSTQARILAERLGATLTRETGGTEIGRRLRDVLHDPTNTHLDPIAESLMIAADRAQHRAEVLEPVLSAGGRIVSDRSVWSSLAYQGYGRGLDLDMIRQVNDWALGGFWPDLVVVVDVSSDVVAERLRHRDLDRFEREDGAFFERVAAGFTTLAQQHPTSWRIVDGTAAIDDVAAAVWDTVMTWTP